MLSPPRGQDTGIAATEIVVSTPFGRSLGGKVNRRVPWAGHHQARNVVRTFRSPRIACVSGTSGF